jgi:hypothetical protein
MTDEEILDQITNIRVANNSVWMSILALALKSAPAEAKMLIGKVNQNDKKISKLVSELAK